MTPHKKECIRSQRQICDTVLVQPPSFCDLCDELAGAVTQEPGAFSFGKTQKSWDVRERLIIHGLLG
jgi:hypothetical protein